MRGLHGLRRKKEMFKRIVTAVSGIAVSAGLLFSVPVYASETETETTGETETSEETSSSTAENTISVYICGEYCTFTVGDTESVGAAASFEKPESADVKYAKSTSKGIKLKWTKVSGAEYYNVLRSSAKDGDYEVVENVGTDTSFTDESVENGKKYFYKIEAVAGASPESTSLSKRISGVFLGQGNIKSMKTTSSGIRIRVKKTKLADGYILERRSSKDGSYEKIGTITSGTTYVDETAVPDTIYYYRVRPYRYSKEASGYGRYSDEDSVYYRYMIMGESTVTVDQMVAIYKASGCKYPSKIYKKKGAANIREFCEIIMEEAQDEGVRAELVFAQAMIETG